ncbi:MAG: hypothetical protein M3112_05840 [Actinomycetia bacterium]|nr:hypothetical protein [Actinomycetes bacterium]
MNTEHRHQSRTEAKPEPAHDTNRSAAAIEGSRHTQPVMGGSRLSFAQRVTVHNAGSRAHLEYAVSIA